MKYNFNTVKEYTAPMCKVYSVSVETVIATSPNTVDDEPENPQGDF
jgi:hypothetical protein